MGSFSTQRSQSAKRQSSHQCLFALWGSLHTKSALKSLVKLTPDVLQNKFPSSLIKQASFFTFDLIPSFSI
jgi:hypothetical protein